MKLIIRFLEVRVGLDGVRDSDGILIACLDKWSHFAFTSKQNFAEAC